MKLISFKRHEYELKTYNVLGFYSCSTNVTIIQIL